MTRREVIVKALAGVITWAVAASVIRVSERHMRRMKERYEQYGVDGLQDLRAGRPRARRVSARAIEEVCRLKRDVLGCPNAGCDARLTLVAVIFDHAEVKRFLQHLRLFSDPIPVRSAQHPPDLWTEAYDF